MPPDNREAAAPVRTAAHVETAAKQANDDATIPDRTGTMPGLTGCPCGCLNGIGCITRTSPLAIYLARVDRERADQGRPTSARQRRMRGAA